MPGEYNYHYAYVGVFGEPHASKEDYAVICDFSGDAELGLAPFRKYLFITDKESARKICLLLTETNTLTLPPVSMSNP